MGAMNSLLVDYEALLTATRVRLTKTTVTRLREHTEFLIIGDEFDRSLAHGLAVLLDMHDKLEAIRHGQA